MARRCDESLPGWRHTGRSWLSAPVTSGSRKTATNPAMDGCADNSPAPCAMPSSNSSIRPDVAVTSAAVPPAPTIAAKPKLRYQASRLRPTTHSSRSAPGKASHGLLLAPAATSSAPTTAGNKSCRKRAAAPGSGFSSAVGNSTGSVPKAARAMNPSVFRCRWKSRKALRNSGLASHTGTRLTAKNRQSKAAPYQCAPGCAPPRPARKRRVIQSIRVTATSTTVVAAACRLQAGRIPASPSGVAIPASCTGSGR